MKGHTNREIISNNRDLKCLLNFLAYVEDKINKAIISALVIEFSLEFAYFLLGSPLLRILSYENIGFLSLMCLGKIILGIKWVIQCCK